MDGKCRFFVGKVCGAEAGLACEGEPEHKSEARLAAEKLLRSGAIDWPTFCKLEENERTYERKQKTVVKKSGSAREQGRADETETEKAFTLVKSIQPMSPNAPPPPTTVTLYTSSAKGRQISTEEDRTRLILDAKKVNYEIVLVDDNPTLQRKMSVVSRLTRLPQLHVQGIYYGDAAVIQEMEDTGELNLILKNATRKSQYGTETPKIAYNDIYKSRDTERKKIAAKRIARAVKQHGKQIKYGAASPLVDKLEQLRLRKATLQLELRKLEAGVMVDKIMPSSTGGSPRVGTRRDSAGRGQNDRKNVSAIGRGKKTGAAESHATTSSAWQNELGLDGQPKAMKRQRSFIGAISDFVVNSTPSKGAEESVGTVGSSSRTASPEQNRLAQSVGRSLEQSRVLRGEGGEGVAQSRSSSRASSPVQASSPPLSTPPAWERPHSPNSSGASLRTRSSPQNHHRQHHHHPPQYFSPAQHHHAIRIQSLARQKGARKRLEHKAHRAYERLYDPETGLDYYYNKQADVSSWEKPRSLGTTTLPLTLE
jgi:glutaredoxin-related protein